MLRCPFFLQKPESYHWSFIYHLYSNLSYKQQMIKTWICSFTQFGFSVEFSLAHHAASEHWSHKKYCLWVHKSSCAGETMGHWRGQWDSYSVSGCEPHWLATQKYSPWSGTNFIPYMNYWWQNEPQCYNALIETIMHYTILCNTLYSALYKI